ncbi:DUF4129 domain-containing protein [Haliscomenobacter hydrossis]|uniref:Protein-glutamine gamma-glutamyltransferase-like C-terminal domain-containing protein n=1 Tax=Haliscomenobacter hydrossis (strain ATCC 27775 / DSM 1100 / LMG 10767 / O) TaxID=760192 RepID=F4KYS2_HALH1|nr:DUF4129 domain-containing protein [Haliscomenobacter hydrossis]AEE51464.1 hypothetical protein Halhy_3612 [Haliscomenobacter hydrossis DSM 1100]
MRYKIWATLCLLLTTIAENAIVAQENFARTQEEKYLTEPIQTQHFDENTWNSSIEGLDYTIKRKAPPPVKAKKKRWNGAWPSLGAGILLALKVIAILLLAFILALIIRHYFNAPRNIAVRKIVVEDMSIEDIEEHLEETELNPFIRKAIDQNDYTLAIRLYYLEMLKQLSSQKAIHWRKNKTNRQYLQEMAHSPWFVDFRTLTLIFERVRYGGMELSRPEFEEIEPNFTTFLEGIAPADYAPPPAKIPV